MLKNRIHSTLINFGRPCPVTDLFGREGRKLLERLDVPEPWRSNVAASLCLIDDLGTQIDDANRRLRSGHANHPYVQFAASAPGIGWVLAFTIAASGSELLTSRKHVPDRVAKPPRDVDLGDLGPALLSEPALGALIALGVGGMVKRVHRRLEQAQRR